MPDDIIKFGRVRFKVKEIISPAYRKIASRTEKKQSRFLKDRKDLMVSKSGMVKMKQSN